MIHPDTINKILAKSARDLTGRDLKLIEDQGGRISGGIGLGQTLGDVFGRPEQIEETN